MATLKLDNVNFVGSAADQKISAHNDDAAAHGGVRGSPFVQSAGTATSETKFILGMDAQKRVVASSGTTLYVSADNGATWAENGVVDVVPTGFRQLSDGEVLVGVGESPGASKKASIWKSTGWASGSPTFAKVLESSGYSQSFSLAWAWGHYGDIVVTNEYGTDARYVYLSQDCGATWSTIYDNTTSVTPTRHLHGSTYDPWRGAIWISGGDWNSTDDNPHISVSWDLGQNWTKVTNTLQPTAIVAFPGCVCFGSDNTPNGVWRIRNPSTTNLEIEEALRLDDALTTTYVALGWYRAEWSDLSLMYWGGRASGTVGVVLGSYNGYDWFRVWTDTENTSEAFRAVGPTTDGKLVIRKDLSSNKTTVVIDAPVNSIEASCARAAEAASQRRKTPFAYFPNVSSPYQQITDSIPTVVQMKSIFGKSGSPYSYNRDDIDGSFKLNDDGLGVTIKRDGVYQISADGCFDSAAGVVGWTELLLNGGGLATADGRLVSAILRLSAGAVLGVRVTTMTTNTLNGGNVLQLARIA